MRVCRPALPGLRTVRWAKESQWFFTPSCDICDMHEDERKNAKTQFAIAVARGVSASSWARTNRQGFSHRDADAKSLLDERFAAGWGERDAANGRSERGESG